MRILFLDTVHEILEQRLTAAGFTCDHDYASDYAAVKSEIAAYDGLVIRSRIPVDARLIEAALRLQFIARSGAGLENIDLDAAKAADVKVFHSPEGNRDAVGEQAVGMLLMLLNNLRRADDEVRKGIWKREENRGFELGAMTVGLIGYGNTGRALAQKLSGFGCKVLAYDKYRAVDGPYAESVSLEQLKHDADVVSLHLPLSAETNRYVDGAFLASCKLGVILINTARGKHLVLDDLVAAMREGQVGGVCLDVLEYEKRSFESLRTEDLPEAFRYLTASDRTILTPHIAGWTHESYYKLSNVLADKIIRHFF